MSGDWEVGDLALCIDGSNGGVTVHGIPTELLEKGKVYTVEGIDADPAFAQVGLHLVGVPRPWSDKWQTHVGWAETRFRKVTPPAADEFDRETIALLNGNPVTVPA